MLLTITGAVPYKFGYHKGTYGQPTTSNGDLNLSLMWKVKSALEQMYLDKDKIDKNSLVYGAIQGMVASLEDPYTVFLPPKENKSSNQDLAGELGGVGISLGFKDKQLAVMSPLSKTPADKAGLKAGDLILHITDKVKSIDRDTQGISLNEAVELIRGEVGSEVTLKMFREGDKTPKDITLRRENIVVPSVELSWSDKDGKKVAVIKLNKFTDRLDEEWDPVVQEVKNKSKDSKFGGIVLDLRNNPGGYLQASVAVASDFLKSGVVVKQQSSDGTTETYDVDKNKGNLIDEKMVVLVNGGSASAAEILAGALRQHDRVKLVGEKSFGKGTVQQPENFPDGSGIHITIAKWLLPDGTNIHKVGVNPDVEVKYEEPKDPSFKVDNQLNKAIEVLLQ